VSRPDGSRGPRAKARPRFAPPAAGAARAHLVVLSLPVEFSGRIASVPVADLLQWAHNDRRTGCLVVRTSHRQKRVSFEDGAVVGCHSDDPAEFFGQFLRLDGLLGEAQIVEALTYCREHQRRLGSALVELGMLGVEEVRQALGRQIADAVCDLMLWRHGVFYFEHLAPSEEGVKPPPLDPRGLAMEGSRWIDELARIRSVFVHDNIVLVPGEPGQARARDALQQNVLTAIDGRVTLAELYDRVKGSYFRFLEAAFDLTVRGVLEIDSVGEEVAPGSQEIRLFELLMEQAAQEDVVFTSRHLSLPLEVLQEFFPVWVEPEREDAEAAEEADPAAVDFYRAMDGTRSLHQLVLEAEHDRERRMELVLLQLRRGNLALLPRSLPELRSRQPAARRAWLRRLFRD
jgi:hypothetical protein